MWILLCCLFALSFFHTALNISLIQTRLYKLFYTLGISLVIIVTFPWAKSLNINTVDEFLADYQTLSLACTIQVFEALLVMFVSLLLIRGHYRKSELNWKEKLAERTALIPAAIFIVGIFISQTYVFNNVEQWPFYLLSVCIAVAFFFLLLVSSWLLKKLLGSWEVGVEVKIVLAFLQALLAMFLPILITGKKIAETHFVINLWQVAATLAGLLIIILLGLAWQKLRAERIVL